MKILDKKIEYNLTNVDNMEILKNAIEDSKQKVSNINTTDNIQKLKSICQIIRECFEKVLPNTNILPKENDFVVLMQAYTDLCLEFANAQQEANNKFQNVITKYKIG